MPKAIVTATPATAELTKIEPVLPNWVLSGNPVTRAKNFVRSRDWTTGVVIWECSAGQFHWHYAQDEVVFVVEGEVFITDHKGEERRLGPGDIAFFPAGTSSIWRVPVSVRKVAVVKESLWRPLGFAVKAWKKLLRMSGLGGKAPL